jgi:hypothetical protein
MQLRGWTQSDLVIRSTPTIQLSVPQFSFPDDSGKVFLAHEVEVSSTQVPP